MGGNENAGQIRADRRFDGMIGSGGRIRIIPAMMYYLALKSL